MNAFDRLDRKLQETLWRMKWEELRKFQVETIHAWFDRDDDLLLMAKTAAGKTEAAFLPILSSILTSEKRQSVRVLYIGPLKALINDQFTRIEELCGKAEIPVYRWHGDVSRSHKDRLLKSPDGVLLITPESLESLLMRRPNDVARMFQGLDAVVIDELHVFLGSERGCQLRSQLHRLNLLKPDQQRTRRIGLSATIGEVEVARRWLAGTSSASCHVIESNRPQAIQLAMKTFSAPKASEKEKNENASESHGLGAMAQHAWSQFSAGTNLIFCNRKTQIEILADRLTQIARKHGRSSPFFVHHGSLSKETREDTEAQLHKSRACTAVCSSTLELGIDVGAVNAVGQVGPPNSVSALKQRLGRSGRRGGEPSRLMMYVLSEAVPKDSPLPKQFHPELLHAIALIELMVGKKESWVEPIHPNPHDFSTFIQQILSIVVQRGGIEAGELASIVCTDASFSEISIPQFKDILRSLGQADLLEQASDGLLILGLAGEQLTKHWNFYAAFETNDDYEVRSSRGLVGQVSGNPGEFQPGQFLLLAGKRWKIDIVDEKEKLLIVIPAKGKKESHWFGTGGNIHERIRQEMQKILLADHVPDWLDEDSAALLNKARMIAKSVALPSGPSLLTNDQSQYLFTWTSSQADYTLTIALRRSGIVSDYGEGIARTISRDTAPRQKILETLEQFIKSNEDPEDFVVSCLGGTVPPVGKFGEHLDKYLRAEAYAAKYIDILTAKRIATELLESSITLR